VQQAQRAARVRLRHAGARHAAQVVGARCRATGEQPRGGPPGREAGQRQSEVIAGEGERRDEVLQGESVVGKRGWGASSPRRSTARRCAREFGDGGGAPGGARLRRRIVAKSWRCVRENWALAVVLLEFRVAGSIWEEVHCFQARGPHWAAAAAAALHARTCARWARARRAATGAGWERGRPRWAELAREAGLGGLARALGSWGRGAGALSCRGGGLGRARVGAGVGSGAGTRAGPGARVREAGGAGLGQGHARAHEGEMALGRAGGEEGAAGLAEMGQGRGGGLRGLISIFSFLSLFFLFSFYFSLILCAN
jgi:hypothetical protein